MDKMSDADKQKIVAAFLKRGVTLPCPRCGNNKFTLLDGYFNQTIQVALTGIVIGGPSVPSAVVACDRCGFLSQHALGALGLMPPGSEEKK